MFHPERFRYQSIVLAEILNHKNMFGEDLSQEHLDARQAIFRYILEVPTPDEKCDPLKWGMLVQVVVENISHFQQGQEDLWLWIKNSAGNITYELRLQNKNTIDALQRERDQHAVRIKEINRLINDKRKEKGWPNLDPSISQPRPSPIDQRTKTLIEERYLKDSNANIKIIAKDLDVPLEEAKDVIRNLYPRSLFLKKIGEQNDQILSSPPTEPTTRQRGRRFLHQKLREKALRPLPTNGERRH